MISLAGASLLAMGGRGTQGDPLEVVRGVVRLCEEALRHLEVSAARDRDDLDEGAYFAEAAERIGAMADAMLEALDELPSPAALRDRVAYDPGP